MKKYLFFIVIIIAFFIISSVVYVLIRNEPFSLTLNYVFPLEGSSFDIYQRDGCDFAKNQEHLETKFRITDDESCLDYCGGNHSIPCGIHQLTETLVSSFPVCIDGWKVTTTYLSYEKDFSGQLVTIAINGEENQFDSLFLKDLKSTMAGLTSSNELIFWNGQNYEFIDLTSHSEHSFRIGMATVDPTIISMETQFYTEDIPHPWEDYVFTATGSHSEIQGKHIEIFTGFGKSADLQGQSIERNDVKFCFLPQN